MSQDYWSLRGSKTNYIKNKHFLPQLKQVVAAKKINYITKFNTLFVQH